MKPTGGSTAVILTLAILAGLTWVSGGHGVSVVFVVMLVAYLLIARRGPIPQSALGSRVEFLERRVAELENVVDELRRRAREAAARAPQRAAAPTPTSPRPAAPLLPAPKLPPRMPPARPTLAARSLDWGRTVSLADLMGAKALAFAGGVVTLLGIVFFFVLAVNRGWIGPGMRVACGGVASTIVFGAGLWLQRRYATTYSSLAAVGTGIAGGYATLLAAVSLYDMVSKPVALVIAGAIASVGVAVSLAWSAEIVAAFGLIGAMIVPATLVFQGGLQEIGTAFVAVVFAGAAVVAVRKRWWTLLQVSALVSVPQALAQFAEAGSPHAGIVTLATVFWLLYLAAGLAFQLRLGPALAGVPASFVIGGAVFGGISAALLYGQRANGVQQGIALLVIAAVYLAVSLVLFRHVREPATLMWVLGLTAAAVGLADVLSGPSLTYAWAAEAALLAWVGSRVRDARFQLPALVYLGLALVHVVAFEASPEHLFEAVRRPAGGAPALLAVALAAIVFAGVNRSRHDTQSAGILRVLDPLVAWLRAQEAAIDTAVFALAAVLTGYVASLGILELSQALSSGPGIETPFEWGHVAVSIVWSAAGLAAVIAALRVRSTVTLVLALSWLALTTLKVVAFDTKHLTQTQYGIALLSVGATVLVAGLARESVSARLTAEGSASIIVGLPLILGGAFALVPEAVLGANGNGLVLAIVGGLYTALGAAAFVRRQRDLSTVLWGIGLAAVVYGDGLLFSGFWLALALALTAAALAVVSVATHEHRLQIAALVYLGLGAARALLVDAPPFHLVRAMLNPGHGVPSLLLVIGATVVFAWAVGWSRRYRLQAIWVAGGLAVYAASLLILEAMQRISPGSVHTNFQRGHTAVSAFWGLLALASLYVGLQRRYAVLRGGGFILFGISLGKIFLFDLPSLSSVQRALSFLAVGAVLLLGGFFYQRLTAQYDR